MKAIFFGIFLSAVISANAADLSDLTDPEPYFCAPTAVNSGDQLSVVVSNPLAKKCEATLRSVTEAFLPVSYLFDRRTCLGPQVAELTIPNEAPNGAALLFWSCDSQPIEFCNLVNITSESNQEGTMPTLTSGALSCSDVSSTLHTSLRSSTTDAPSLPGAGEAIMTGTDFSLSASESSTLAADTSLPLSETMSGTGSSVQSFGSSAAGSATSAAKITPSVPQVMATVTATVLATSFVTVPCSETP